MMKLFSPSAVRPMMVGSVVLIVVAAFVLRYTALRVPQMEPSSPSVSSERQGLPAFTSASFETGDALGSLGPEWTLIRQNEIQGNSASTLSGTMPTRETLVHLSGASTVMLMTEFNVTDAAALKKAVSAQPVQPLTVGGRSGFLVPVPSLAGGSAFLLVGTSTALMLEYGENQDGALMEWPSIVPEAIQSYVSAVKMY